MEISIKGTPKEIAELALELQGRQNEEAIFSDDDDDDVEFSIPSIIDECGECPEKIQHTLKIKTFGDFKKAFKKLKDAFVDSRADEERYEDMKKAFTKFIDDEEQSWKKDFLTKDFKTSDTPRNHEPPEGYIHISELSLAVSGYIADQRLRKNKKDLADPFVPDQSLSEFIKAYWSKHCDLQSNE